MAQPERNMTEITPGPGPEGPLPVDGIPPSVEAVRQAGYIEPPMTGQVPESVAISQEIKNQLSNPSSSEVEVLIEKTREKKSDPHYWMDILQELHDLPATERRLKKAEYAEACRRLAVFAHDGKLFGNSAAVTILEEQLTDFEKQEIQTGSRTAEEQELLQDSLDALFKQEFEYMRVVATLGLEKMAADLFTKDEWEELKKRRDQLVNDPELGITGLRTKISGITSTDFLKNRDSKIDQIKKAVEEVRVAEERRREQDWDELRGEPDDWEKQQEELLLADKEPLLKQPPEDAFAKQLVLFNEQQKLKDEADPSFSQDQYDRAREGLEWYFHQARKEAVFDLVEQGLDQKYQEWANALMPHREADPYGRPGRVIQKTFADLQTEMIEYFDGLLDTGKPQSVEHPTRWNQLQRQGLVPQARQVLQGIRAELVRRAQIQIEDSLLNLDQQLKGRPGLAPIDRISGEWNVHRLERIIESRRERHEAQERSRPLFIQESYYRIVLLGQNREEIERGADQAADSIIQSATTFSLDVVRQRMEQLMTAIKEQQSTLEVSEGVSEAEARRMVTEIQHTYTNKLDFFILDWTSANLLMDQFAGYYSDRMRMAGDEKLKLIPAGHDGLDGLAIHWLMSPEFRLYHRPQGFAGQLYDDDQTHKVMRALMRDKIVGRLMEYELKGRDFREKANNRQKLTNSPTIYEYLQQFDHKGIIPSGIIPEDMIIADASGGKDPTQFFNGLSSEQRAALVTRLNPKQQEQLFYNLKPAQQVEIREYQYQQILQQVKAKSVITFEDLTIVRSARQRLAQAKNNFSEIKAKAESAFDAADKVMNVFGDATVLSAPSIVMENDALEVRGPEGQIIKRGDYISINDYVLVQKYAILQAAKGLATYTDTSGKQIRVDDNLALIRSRSKEWISRWKRSGLDRSKTSRDFIIELPNGESVTIKLAEGFEETGLTEAEWQAFNDTAKLLREEGYETEINGKEFADIVKLDELQPVLNNFLVDYKSSMSEINDPNVIEKAARGRFISIANIRKRLGFSGRKRLEGTTQQEIDAYTQRIEDSRSLHAELERLAYFEATHDLTKPPIARERGKPVYEFSADRIDYGYQRPWGVKRLHHLKAFWYANLRRTVPRAVDLIHAVPISLSSLAREHSFDNILQMSWDIKKMESLDNPSLVMTGERHDDLVSIRSSAEGTVAKGQGGLKKVWGFWEKPLVDANALWKAIEGKLPGVGTRQALEKFLVDPDSLSDGQAEGIVDAVFEALGRLEPLLTASEKSLGEDRQALSAGTGYDENDKFLLRFIEWFMSEKSGSGREQGGMEVQKEISDIIKLITTPGTFKPGIVYISDPKTGRLAIDKGKKVVDAEHSPSIWEEVARKLTPSHNPRINRILSPSFVRL